MSAAALMAPRDGVILRWSVATDSARQGALSPVAEGLTGNLGFHENDVVHIERPPGGPWFFRVDDVPLSTNVSASSSNCGFWMWQPGFYAGEVTAELVDEHGAVHSTYLLDVSPHPGKVGRDMFRTMLDDIRAEDPLLLLGTEPATLAAGVTGHATDPHVMYARLRRYGPTLLRALQSISREPISVVCRHRETIPVHRLRRIDRATLRSAAHRRDVLDVLLGRTGTSDLPPDRLTVSVPCLDTSLDGAANRCIAHLVRTVLRRVVAVHDELEVAVRAERESDTTTALAPRWAVREQFLRSMASGLRAALDRSPLREVTRAETSSAGLNAVAAHPLYSRVHAAGWRILRTGVGDEPEERLWASPTWQIYERWCFARLATLLRARFDGWTWKRRSKGDHSMVAWVGSDGTRRLELSLQHKFTGGEPADLSGPRSLSTLRIPDIVLTRRESGRTSFVVLDAKYRISAQAVLDAMESAHVYHDSLRLDGTRPVRALILIPATNGAAWLHADAFQREHGIGAVRFDRETGLDALEGLLPCN